MAKFCLLDLCADPLHTLMVYPSTWTWYSLHNFPCLDYDHPQLNDDVQASLETFGVEAAQNLYFALNSPPESSIQIDLDCPCCVSIPIL